MEFDALILLDGILNIGFVLTAIVWPEIALLGFVVVFVLQIGGPTSGLWIKGVVTGLGLIRFLRKKYDDYDLSG